MAVLLKIVLFGRAKIREYKVLGGLLFFIVFSFFSLLSSCTFFLYLVVKLLRVLVHTFDFFFFT